MMKIINPKIVQRTAKIRKIKILHKMSSKLNFLIIDLEFIDFN
jgi:hypothetical protein